MWKNIKSLFFKEEPYIKFKAVYGDWSIATPVLPMSKFKTKWQTAQTKETSISHCPGMYDYLSSGYIITAHVDFLIKANRAGVSIMVRNCGSEDLHDSLKPNHTLNPALVKGIYNPTDNVKPQVRKINLPWVVTTPPGYSVYSLPCLLQAEYLDKITVWPGVVDTDNFHFVNFIFSVNQECEFEIPAGTPLLHVIPFKRETFRGETGKATEKEFDIYKYHMVSRVAQVYRKFFHSKKKFEMTGSDKPRYNKERE